MVQIDILSPPFPITLPLSHLDKSPSHFPIPKQQPEITCETIGCHRINPSQIQSPFFLCARNNNTQQDLSFYDISQPRGSPHIPITTKLVLNRTDSLAFIEVTKPVNQLNKETLSSLLDFADESQATCLVACVGRHDPHYKEILRSFISIGFLMANADLNLCIKMPDYFLLVQEF